MAVLRDFGKSDNDLGAWEPFGTEAPFDVRIRRIPQDIAKKISERHGKETFVVHEGIRRPQIDRTIEQSQQWVIDQAIWAWTDVRRLEIAPEDEDGVKLWAGLLKREVSSGEAIELTRDMLTAEVKRRVLIHLRPFCSVVDDESGKKEKVDLGTFIIYTAAKRQLAFAEDEKRAEGNS